MEEEEVLVVVVVVDVVTVVAVVANLEGTTYGASATFHSSNVVSPQKL